MTEGVMVVPSGGCSPSTYRSKELLQESGPPRMTKEGLKRLCRKHDLYSVPALNDVLYLHFQGYTEIENLEAYTGLKCLWLENNGLRTITNLHHLHHLRSLHLHHNLLTSLHGLQDLHSLVSLNVSNNMISNIEHIGGLPHLETLQMSHNRLKSTADLAPLTSCPALTCIDLSHNNISDWGIAQTLEEMKELRVVQLTGNSGVGQVRPYRTCLILACPNLTYLDDRPVFPVDRAASEAWREGGVEAERACRREWAERRHRRQQECVNDVLRLRARVLAEKASREKAEAESKGATGDSGTPGEEGATNKLGGGSFTNNMGIYVEDNGEEKLYALTPEAIQWAENRLKKAKEKRETRDTDEAGPSSQNTPKDTSEANSDAVLHAGHYVQDLSLSTGAPKCEDCVREPLSHHEDQEGIPDDPCFNKLLENISEDSDDIANFDGFKTIAYAGNVEKVVDIADAEGIYSSESETELQAENNVDMETTGNNTEVIEVIEMEKCNNDELENQLPNIAVSKGITIPDTETPTVQIVEQNEPKTSESSISTSNEQHQKQEDLLLLTSCQNFLRQHSTNQEFETGGEVSSPEDRLPRESTEGDDADADSEVDSDPEAQAYVRQLVRAHNSQPQNESDIEEILESLQFDGGSLRTAYRYRRNHPPAPGIPDSYSQEASEHGVAHPRVRQRFNDPHRNSTMNAPLFGERWVEEARVNMMEGADWQEDIDSSSTTSDDEGNVDDYNVETPEESSYVEDGSQAGVFEGESVSSVSPLSSKHEAPPKLLKCEPPTILGQNAADMGDSMRAEPAPNREESDTTSSCSSLSLSSLSDSPKIENNHLPCNTKLPCNPEVMQYKLSDNCKLKYSLSSNANTCLGSSHYSHKLKQKSYSRYFSGSKKANEQDPSLTPLPSKTEKTQTQPKEQQNKERGPVIHDQTIMETKPMKETATLFVNRDEDSEMNKKTSDEENKEEGTSRLFIREVDASREEDRNDDVSTEQISREAGSSKPENDNGEDKNHGLEDMHYKPEDKHYDPAKMVSWNTEPIGGKTEDGETEHSGTSQLVSREPKTREAEDRETKHYETTQIMTEMIDEEKGSPKITSAAEGEEEVSNKMISSIEEEKENYRMTSAVEGDERECNRMTSIVDEETIGSPRMTSAEEGEEEVSNRMISSIEEEEKESDGMTSAIEEGERECNKMTRAVDEETIGSPRMTSAEEGEEEVSNRMISSIEEKKDRDGMASAVEGDERECNRMTHAVDEEAIGSNRMPSAYEASNRETPRLVTRDRETLAGDSPDARYRDRIFSTRRALCSSHHAFVAGRNVGGLLVTAEEGDHSPPLPPLLLPSPTPAQGRRKGPLVEEVEEEELP